MIPRLVQARKAFNESDLVIIGFNIWEQGSPEARARKVREYMKKHGINYTVVLGKDAVAKKYGVRGIPDAVIVDPRGNVAFKGHPGSGKFAETIENLVSDLRKEKLDEIRKSVEKGKFELTVARGKGTFSTLAAAPEGFRVMTVRRGKVTVVEKEKKSSKGIGGRSRKELAGMVKALIDLEEKARVGPDQNAIYAVIRSRKNRYFILGAAAEAAPDALKKLADWLDEKTGR